MKKIAYILDTFPIVSETFIYNELKELSDYGYKIRIYVRDKPKTTKFENDLSFIEKNIVYLDDLNYKMVYLKTFIKFPLGFLRAFTFYKNQVARSDYGILQQSCLIALDTKKEEIKHIHAHFATDPALTALLVKKITGIPYSFTAHAYDIFISPFMLKEKMDMSKFVVSVCDYNLNWLKNYYPEFPLKKYLKVICGVKIDLFKFKKPNIGNNNYSFLCVARLIEKKGIKYLIEAVSKLHKEGLNFKCDIIGGGPLKEELLKLAKSKKVDKVINFLGEISDTKVINDYYQKASVFILPCIQAENGDRDSMPVVIKEAMSVGVPVIATKEFGIPEMIKDGENGILVESKSAESLHEGIKRFLNLSKKEIEEMTLKARKKVEQEFDIKKETQKLINMFES